jgi:hypothetical protein
MSPTGGLAPDHKTIADFKNGPAIRAARAQFVVLCQQIGQFGGGLCSRETRPSASPTPSPARGEGRGN